MLAVAFFVVAPHWAAMQIAKSVLSPFESNPEIPFGEQDRGAYWFDEATGEVQIEAVGFAAELRRLTTSWYTHKFGVDTLWGEAPTDDERDA